MVDYNKKSFDDFIKNNIEQFNKKPSDFKMNESFNDTDIKQHLRDKFISELPAKKDELIKKFKEKNYVKSKIEDIANEFGYYKKDLETFFAVHLYQELLKKVDTDSMVEALKEAVSNKINDDKAFGFIKNDFEKLAKKVIEVLKMKGFSTNLLGINEGVMLANSGDSAQFLFLSRAILAGYNCSNVDVRSSRYDAIIDYGGKLLKVQVKGISDNNIQFKDRDRGGQGIDYTHERNRGKMISSKDCDIYVAVDKQCGICYLIPVADFIDKIDAEKKEKPINISEVEKYRENWGIIKEIAENR